jgi:hypothetical protein
MRHVRIGRFATLLVAVVTPLLLGCRSSDMPQRDDEAIAALAAQTRAFQSSLNAATRTAIGSHLEPAIASASNGGSKVVWKCTNGDTESGKAACDKIGTILSKGGCICRSTSTGSECDCS